MKNTILFSVMSAALLSMSTVFAGGGSLFGGSDESSAMDNIYVGGSIGQATTNCMLSDVAGVVNDKEIGSIDYSKDCDMDGWKVYGGYKFNENFAIEGGYYNLGDTEESVTNPDNPSHQIHADGESSGIALSGVASYEVMDRLEVFGKLGIMKYESEGELSSSVDGASVPLGYNATTGDPINTMPAESDGTSLLWGVGAGYKITDNVGIRGEYEGFTREDVMGKDQDVTLLSAGLTFSTY